MTDSALQALSRLRDPSGFEWYIIPILVMVIYFYSVDIGKKNWNVVFAGLAFWGMDWFNEIWNALVLHFSQYAPVWGAPGKTSFLILAGLNIEICLMFAVMGLAAAHLLPEDRSMKIMGLPNRLFFAAASSIACVVVEIFLNHADALIWEYSWWSIRNPWLVFLIGYMPFFLVSYRVFDMETVKSKSITVGAIFGINITALIIFGGILKWI